MSIETLIKRIQDIMRQDSGVDGDAQRISQMVWLLFLKVYDAKEELWEFYDENYKSIIPEELRWRNWAVDEKDGKALTGEKLLDFVNNELFPTLKDLKVDETIEKRSAIVKYVFEDVFNYMKNGTLLRQIINVLNEVDFTEYEERHTFNDIYENILKDLQSAGNAGEFYTPRPVTEFLIEMLNPQIGESIADLACGTGGFLTSAISHMESQVKTPEDKKVIQRSLFGIEKKPLPYLLAMTNLVLHDIDSPNLIHGNSLSKNVRDYKEEDRYSVIAMNPPYGGTEEDAIKVNFPVSMQSSETADLFMTLIMYRLKKNGRAGVVLPDGFLFATDGAKRAIKEKLLTEFNLHTIVRLPKGVFSPYTDIPTNLLFFDKTVPTKEIWYYGHPLPQGFKNYTKTRPIKLEEFKAEIDWWNNRTENEYAWKVSIEEIISKGYNLDFKNPNKADESTNLTASEILFKIQEKNQNIHHLIEELNRILR
ncbi:class I SAM-dependent DNA methyltransferase [Neobacillus mesonae]|uniref:class I SAM-dependent DNA methyltransferase n=1 Tax=Neobacillus mesonae TaxID=1193713 RepID=UPI0020415733|nr:class I SAM-dependent DNA methyltransferase [Neobacillus mesonae]MCM3567566.1 type I restriction-modification system subunit M [Neobacillus mesonae]